MCTGTQKYMLLLVPFVDSTLTVFMYANHHSLFFASVPLFYTRTYIRFQMIL